MGSQVADFATSLINSLTASPANRDEAARTALKTYDANADGQISSQEFQKIFAAMQREEQLSGKQGTGESSTFRSAGVRPTIFACTLYPSFSKNYALSKYQAGEMLTGLDKDADNQVSLDELRGVTAAPATDTTTPPDATPPTDNTPPPPPDTPPPTPEERADGLMAEYDKTDKGYITLGDITSAWVLNPKLGDVSQLANTMVAWDTSGDGQITRSELVQGFTIMDAADTLLIQFANPPATPNDPVAIQIADVSDANLKPFELTRDQLTGWDTNSDGAVTREELVSGLRALSLQAAPPTPAQYAQALLNKYDSNGDNALSFDEFQKAFADASQDQSSSQATFDSWDLNKDGAISAAELTDGVDTAQQAKALVAKYDIGAKGYFDVTDLQAAIDASPQDATGVTAQEMLAAWDLDGNGKVTAQDIINLKQLDKLTTPSNV